MKDPVISISNLSKVYKLYKEPVDRLKESLHPFGKKYHQDFFALKNLSLDIFEGEIVGVVGANGAGKSTLLKILAGVLTPTTGDVQLNGRVSALLELGMGFNPELSGRENIIFNATILGLSPRSIDAKLDEIISFADIGAYIDQPLKSYSSGMVARLAFAVAVNIDAEILIIDEALSVGDVRFQQKALRKLQELMARAKVIIFVSHSLDSIKRFCNRTIWIKDGKIHEDGHPKEVIKSYYASMTSDAVIKVVNNKEAESSNFSIKASMQLDKETTVLPFIGDQKVSILGVSLFDDADRKINVLKGGEILYLMIKFYINEKVDFPSVAFTINNALGLNVFGISSHNFNLDWNELMVGSEYVVKILFKFPFVLNGTYTMSLVISSVYPNGEKLIHHKIFDALILEVQSSSIMQRHGSIIIPTQADFSVDKIEL